MDKLPPYFFMLGIPGLRIIDLLYMPPTDFSSAFCIKPSYPGERARWMGARSCCRIDRNTEYLMGNEDFKLLMKNY
ncbi:MAG: hypothetical protein J4473_05315 [Candidatus Aenigmarchaeota archaeon]|nr:hypothetical protein [Candidatus Aenigmarchaeota archaeon]